MDTVKIEISAAAAQVLEKLLVKESQEYIYNNNRYGGEGALLCEVYAQLNKIEW